MKRIFFIIILLGIAFVFISSCYIDDEGNLVIIPFFENDLRGTWETNDPGSRYLGNLEIMTYSIKITGFSENQTPIFGGDDNERPFKGITRNVNLTGYSEDGKIYIKDAGTYQEGISYIYYTISGNRYLRFNFSGRDQTLKKVVAATE